ncbi:MAG: SDR family oxidoreductase [Candidatus Acidiferrales bacterium]
MNGGQVRPSEQARQGAAESGASPSRKTAAGGIVYWRVEGSLVDMTAVRQVAYFTWNAHTFIGRWARRGAVAATAITRPAFYFTNKRLATRTLDALLRGVTRDRLDLLGEEYFQYVIKPQLKQKGVEKLRECLAANDRVILVSHGLDHVICPLARYLGVERVITNRLEFRDGLATGRVLDPVIPPRGAFALVFGGAPDGRVRPEKLMRALKIKGGAGLLEATARPAPRTHRADMTPVVLTDVKKPAAPLSVRETLRGKHVMLVGVTGFIGKVWLEQILTEVPDIGKVYLLIRRQKSATAARRFEKIAEESPVFEPLNQGYGDGFGRFLAEHVEVVKGDVSRPDLGMEEATRKKLATKLDLVVNSSGLTDFNPDLREALAGNVGAPMNILEFLRTCDHAALLHLSTCYVVGRRDGRVREELKPNYTPAGIADFNAEHEWRSLADTIRNLEARSEGPEMTAALRRQALGRRSDPSAFSTAEVANVLRRNRQRWQRNRLTRVGTRRAQRLGWPNTYTLTKSLAESLLISRGAGLPIAIVRPSIVETSTEQPFPGWNEGINTSAPLSYLLGTYFRQLPTNARKCLDVIPVDMVCRGMTLIAAALIQRRHEEVYQLATSAVNPCNMGRSIELTGLAHRKHYRAQQGLEHWLRMRFDTIPVSMNRYQKLSVPAQKAVISGINRAMEIMRFKKPLVKAERDLGRIENLIELYEPFILHNEQVFECDNVLALSEALPAEERKAFDFDPASVDWWDYWINIHVPALRKWCYPLIEGRALEPQPKRSVQFAAVVTGENGGDSSAQAAQQN